MSTKIIALILTLSLLLVVFASCGTQKASDETTAADVEETTAVEETAEDTTEDTAEADNTLSGGWTLAGEPLSTAVPEDAAKAFENAFENFTGSSVTLVAYLGSQVVAGTNYAYLCQVTPMVAEPTTSFKVVTVYADLEGNTEVGDFYDFDITPPTDAGEDSDELAGGWTVNADDYTAVKLPDEVQNAFDLALGEMTGADYVPLAYLGSQVVAGTNYAVLCLNTPVVPDAVSTISVLYIYAALDGTATVTEFKGVDLATIVE